MRRALIVAWSPAALLIACLAVSVLAGVSGHRTLSRMADAQLEVAGRYVAHHFNSAVVSRLRVLQSAAAIDAQSDGEADRARQRRAMIDSLVRLHPELVWVGFADAPGRVAVAHRDLLARSDVSRSDWWVGAMRGPYLGGVHDAPFPGPDPVVDAGPGAPRAPPPRVLDVAVPLRDAGGEPYGVLAAHVDAGWMLDVLGEIVEVAQPLADVDVLVLLRDGSTASGRRVLLDAPGEPDASPVRGGALDGRPRTFSVRPVDGDVVVSRLGWQVAVGRDPAVHEAPARRFLGWTIACGAIVGALGALAIVLLATSADAGRAVR